MKKTVKGSFELSSMPLPSDDTLAALGAMRMRFEKRFQGALEATSVVAMIGVMDPEHESGGYVALERVTGKLDGKKGSFTLQHSSLMNRGAPSQNIQVVPDSATDELIGLAGTFVIDIVDDQHFYTFEYSLL